MWWWASLAVVLLSGFGVLGWLTWLTIRVRDLSTLAQSPPPRVVSGERLELPRLQHAMSDFEEGLKAQMRELGSVERRVADLESASERFSATASDRSRARPAEAPYSEAGAVSRMAPRSAVTPAQATRFEEEVLKAFNELASSFDPAVRDAFIEKYKPTQGAFEAGYFTEQDNGKFWLIDLPDAEYAAILPNGKVARDWEKLYRAMNGMQAQSVFGDVFDIAPGGRLKITAIARVAMSGAGSSLLEKGQLSGI